MHSFSYINNNILKIICNLSHKHVDLYLSRFLLEIYKTISSMSGVLKVVLLYSNFDIYVDIFFEFGL